MLQSNWRENLSHTGLVVCIVILSSTLHAQSSDTAKTLSNDSSNFHINDLVNNERSLKSQDPSKTVTPSASLVTPSIPPALGLGYPIHPSAIDPYSMDNPTRSQAIDLVGIYYAKEIQKAEIIVGGFTHYYSAGDRLNNKWVLKSIEPKRIEIQHCIEKSQKCMFKKIEFTPSIRD